LRTVIQIQAESWVILGPRQRMGCRTGKGTRWPCVLTCSTILCLDWWPCLPRQPSTPKTLRAPHRDPLLPLASLTQSSLGLQPWTMGGSWVTTGDQVITLVGRRQRKWTRVVIQSGWVPASEPRVPPWLHRSWLLHKIW
jgi:hypothetical protein